MVKQLSEHRQKTELYLKILNKATEIGDNHLVCIVQNKIRHHHHQDYAIATPTGGVIIKFPIDQVSATKGPWMPYPPDRRTNKVWMDWAIGFSVFPGSLLFLVGLALGLS